MDGEQLSAVTMEWKVLKERFFAGEPVDPVFEGIVKDFIAFDATLQDIFKKVKVFMKGELPKLQRWPEVISQMYFENKISLI